MFVKRITPTTSYVKRHMAIYIIIIKLYQIIVLSCKKIYASILKFVLYGYNKKESKPLRVAVKNTKRKTGYNFDIVISTLDDVFCF